MKRKLNVKFLVCLLAVTFLFGTGVHFLHGYQVKRNVGTLFGLSQSEEENGNWSEAASLLTHYLAYRPNDAEARANLAMLLARKAKSPRERHEALQALERVVQRDEGRHDVRRRIVEVAMEPTMRRYADAQRHLEKLLKASEGDGKLEGLLGQCFEAEGKYKEAVQSYGKATEHEPREVHAYVRRANLLRHHLNRRKEADVCMDKLVKLCPTADAYLARARYRKEFGPADQATKDLDQAFKFDPNHRDVLLALADSALEKKDQASARRHLEAGLRAHTQDPRFYQALAELDLRESRRAQALSRLREGLKVVPGQVDLLWGLANLLLDEGGDAESEIDMLGRAGARPAHLDFLRARAQVNKRKWLAAIQLLNGARLDLIGVPGLAMQVDYYLGQCYGGLGDPERQYNALRRAVAADPHWMPAILGLGSAQAALGRIDEALETFRGVQSRAPGVQVAVARLLLLKSLNAPPDRRHWDEVEKAIADAERAVPTSAEVVVLRAEMLAAQQTADRAATLLVQARDKNPQKVELWVALILLAERQGQAENARHLLREAERILGDCAELRVVAAAFWSKHGGTEAGIALQRLEEGCDRFATDEQGKLLRALATAHARHERWDACARVWARLAKVQPTDLATRLALFDLAMRSGDGEAMRRRVDELQELEGPDGAVWRYAKACHIVLLARQGKPASLDEARALLTAASARRSGWSRVYLCEGEIDELQNKHSSAFRNYHRAVDLGEHSPELIRRVAQYLYDHHRYADADLVIRKLSDLGAFTPDLQRLVAQVSLQLHDYGRALRLAEEAVARESKDYRDYIWLAQVRWAAGKLDAAEKNLRQAVAQAGDVPDPWVALVLFLARSGKKELAESTLREAGAKLAGPGSHLALAQCAEALGRSAEAEKQYLVSLEKSRDLPTLRAVASFYVQRGERKKAEAFLQEIIGLESNSPDEEKWARRMLAIVLASRGDHRETQRALALLGLLEENKVLKATDAESAADMRAQALVLTQQRGRRPHQRAIEILVRMVDHQEALPEDQFLLARLYDLVNERERALQILRPLVRGDDVPVPILGYYALHVIRDGEAAEAKKTLERLEKVPGLSSTFAVTEVRARLLALSGKGPDAVTALRAYVDSRSGPEGDGRVLPAADLLADLAMTYPAEKAFAAAAERLYREHAHRHPEQVLRLVTFLGRVGRIREALEACEGAWRTAPAETVAVVAVSLLDERRASREQWRRVEQWLQDALAHNPESGRLLAVMANFRYLEHRYTEAIDLYRQALERDPRDAPALNNLAWLLALAANQDGEALERINRAIEILGPVPSLRDTRAIIFMHSGQYRAAAQELQEVLSEDASASHWVHLAQAYAASGDRVNARMALSRAKSLNFTKQQLPPLEQMLCQKLFAEISE